MLTFLYDCDNIIESTAKGNSSMAEQRSPKPSMGVRIPLPLLENLILKEVKSLIIKGF